jgi:sugar phosphate isomerase/epimerase
LAYLQTLQDRHGIPVVSLHTPFFLVDGWETETTHCLRCTVALAEGLGAHTVVVHLPRRFRARKLPVPFRAPVLFPFPGAETAFACWLQEELSAFQAQTPVTIAVENMPRRRFLGMDVPAWQFNTWDELSQMSHLTLDTTHVGTWGFDLLAIYERVKERVAHVHLSNYNGKEHRLPTDGRLPLGELLRRLARDGYAGIVCVETGPEALGAGNDDTVLCALRETLDFYRHHTNGLTP